MKLIAVSQRVDVHPSRNERRDALDQRWSTFMAGCGYGILPIPNAPEILFPLLQTLPVHGVLLTGGNDLGDARERDDTEAELIDWARSRGLPLAGVCRGMQMILTYDGAALERVDGHAGAQHGLSTGETVNSFHNFGFRAAPAAYDILATAPDGVIEMARHRAEPILAMMWHPEREAPFAPRDIILFREFFA